MPRMEPNNENSTTFQRLQKLATFLREITIFCFFKTVPHENYSTTDLLHRI